MQKLLPVDGNVVCPADSACLLSSLTVDIPTVLLYYSEGVLMQGEAPATQAGVQVKHEPERLVLDALMRYKPADLHQLQHDNVAQCGDSAEWGDGLRTEWVCECSCLSQGNTNDRHVSHRLSVQAAPGEMRLATTLITQV